jgi:hypothetical protein
MSQAKFTALPGARCPYDDSMLCSSKYPRYEANRKLPPNVRLAVNDCDKPFEVIMFAESHTFDSFECAIHKLAPSCSHCGCRILHGVEKQGISSAVPIALPTHGATELRDRALRVGLSRRPKYSTQAVHRRRMVSST